MKPPTKHEDAAAATSLPQTTASVSAPLTAAPPPEPPPQASAHLPNQPSKPSAGPSAEDTFAKMLAALDAQMLGFAESDSLLRLSLNEAANSDASQQTAPDQAQSTNEPNSPTAHGSPGAGQATPPSTSSANATETPPPTAGNLQQRLKRSENALRKLELIWPRQRTQSAGSKNKPQSPDVPTAAEPKNQPPSSLSAHGFNPRAELNGARDAETAPPPKQRQVPAPKRVESDLSATVDYPSGPVSSNSNEMLKRPTAPKTVEENDSWHAQASATDSTAELPQTPAATAPVPAAVDRSADLAGPYRRSVQTTSTAIQMFEDLAGTPAGQTFGRFQIVRELGRGGCGVVFLAYDPFLKRDIALKVPRPDVLVSAELRRRFIREAQATAEMMHPNIIPIYEAGEIGPICFTASAFCSGPTLSQWLEDRPNAVPIHIAAGIVATLAAAVQHAHDRGILHRDLKPSNVLLEPLPPLPSESRSGRHSKRESFDYIPKLTDFGLAKVQQIDSTDNETQTGMILGTPRYMSPEQAAGAYHEFAAHTDVFALGIILFELLVGKTPFEGKSDLDTLHRIRNEEAVAPGELRAEVPKDLEAICLKCLEKNPLRRYPTAAALVEDLDRFLRDEPTLARPVTNYERWVRWSRREPLTAGLAIVSVGCFLILVSQFFWYTILLNNANEKITQTLLQKIEKEKEAELVRWERDDFRYAADMRAAWQLWHQHAFRDLQAALLPHFPIDYIDRRGWEWYFLLSQSRLRPVQTVPFSEPLLQLELTRNDRWLWARTKSQRLLFAASHQPDQWREIHLPTSLLADASIWLSEHAQRLAIWQNGQLATYRIQKNEAQPHWQATLDRHIDLSGRRLLAMAWSSAVENTNPAKNSLLLFCQVQTHEQNRLEIHNLDNNQLLQFISLPATATITDTMVTAIGPHSVGSVASEHFLSAAPTFWCLSNEQVLQFSKSLWALTPLSGQQPVAWQLEGTDFQELSDYDPVTRHLLGTDRDGRLFRHFLPVQLAPEPTAKPLAPLVGDLMQMPTDVVQASGSAGEPWLYLRNRIGLCWRWYPETGRGESLNATTHLVCSTCRANFVPVFWTVEKPMAATADQVNQGNRLVVWCLEEPVTTSPTQKWQEGSSSEKRAETPLANWYGQQRRQRWLTKTDVSVRPPNPTIGKLRASLPLPGQTDFLLLFARHIVRQSADGVVQQIWQWPESAPLQQLVWLAPGRRLGLVDEAGHAWVWENAGWQSSPSIRNPTDGSGNQSESITPLPVAPTQYRRLYHPNRGNSTVTALAGTTDWYVWLQTRKPTPESKFGHEVCLLSARGPEDVVKPQPISVQFAKDSEKDPPTPSSRPNWGTTPVTFTAPTSSPTCIAVAASGAWPTVAVGTSAGDLWLWRWSEGQSGRTLPKPKRFIRRLPSNEPTQSLFFDRGGRTLFSASTDGTITLWHVATGEEMFTWTDLPEATNQFYLEDPRDCPVAYGCRQPLLPIADSKLWPRLHLHSANTATQQRWWTIPGRSGEVNQ